MPKDKGSYKLARDLSWTDTDGLVIYHGAGETVSDLPSEGIENLLATGVITPAKTPKAEAGGGFDSNIPTR